MRANGTEKGEDTEAGPAIGSVAEFGAAHEAADIVALAHVEVEAVDGADFGSMAEVEAVDDHVLVDKSVIEFVKVVGLQDALAAVG